MAVVLGMREKQGEVDEGAREMGEYLNGNEDYLGGDFDENFFDVCGIYKKNTSRK